MRETTRIARFASIAALAALAACSSRDDPAVAAPKNDPVVAVPEADPEMNAAIAHARESLPHFWDVFETPTRGESDFALKVRIQDRHGTEHFWVTDLRREDGKVYGLIGNDPDTVTSVKLGDEIQIPAADISDWLYMREGKMVGNFTVRVLFKQMPADEVERLNGILEDP